MDNLKIFISTHVDFDAPVTGGTYAVVSPNGCYTGPLEHYTADLPWVLKDNFYSELYMMTWVSRNIQLPEYVGFCHYSKYFPFLDEIPTMEEILEGNVAAVPSQVTVNGNNYSFYGKCHNIEDLETVGRIIMDTRGDYYDAFQTMCDINWLIPYNMFIMRREHFMAYIQFINGILDEYLKNVGTDIHGYVTRNYRKYLKPYDKNQDITYQERIGGFLAERLTTVFFLRNFPSVRTYDLYIPGQENATAQPEQIETATEDKENNTEEEAKTEETGGAEVSTAESDETAEATEAPSEVRDVEAGD